MHLTGSLPRPGAGPRPGCPTNLCRHRMISAINSSSNRQSEQLLQAQYMELSPPAPTTVNAGPVGTFYTACLRHIGRRSSRQAPWAAGLRRHSPQNRHDRPAGQQSALLTMTYSSVPGLLLKCAKRAISRRAGVPQPLQRPLPQRASQDAARAPARFERPGHSTARSKMSEPRTVTISTFRVTFRADSTRISVK